MENLPDVCSVCSTDQMFPFSPPLFGLPYFLRHNNIKIKQINNLIIGLYISLTLNKKLEMIQFSEKGMSRAERGHKLGLLPQTVSQVMNAKEMFGEFGNCGEIKCNVVPRKRTGTIRL